LSTVNWGAGCPIRRTCVWGLDSSSMHLRRRRNTFSTTHSNGTNKVIDMSCTFLLSSPVYIEAHPRRIAAHGDSFKSFNSFISNSFRTLVAQWSAATPFLSIACGLFPLQWGCTPSSIFIDGLLQSALFPVVHPISLQPLTKCSFRNSFALTTIHFHGGCTPSLYFPQLPLPHLFPAHLPGRSQDHESEHFCLDTSFLLQSPPQGDSSMSVNKVTIRQGSSSRRSVATRDLSSQSSTLAGGTHVR
jgi:hypothetical protein